MEDIKRCLTVLGRLSECGKAPVKNSKFDVVAEVTKALVEALSEANFDRLIPLHQGDGTSPSTSQKPPPSDPRIRLGQLLTSLYSELASSLTLCKKGCEDEFTVLSVQEQAQVSSSLQFFVLAQILPYTEEGVGFPMSKRSAFVKSWTRLTQDISFQKHQILSGLNTMNELMSSNAALQPEILKSFLGDIICANEQLVSLGHPQLEWLEYLLSLVPKSLLISNLLALSKTYNRTKPPPSWFTNALGKRLSDILCSEDGLYQTLCAYIELGGSQFWENSHLLCCFGKQLAVPPKGRKRMAYYENITSQFLKIVFENGALPKNGVIELYSTFVDEIVKREPLAGEVFVLDMIFKPFETLSESAVASRFWSTSMSRSLILLGLFSDDKICPRTVSNNPRLVQIIPLLLGFLMSSCFDEKETLPSDLKMLSENISRILQFVGKKVENIHSLLMAFILSNKDCCYTIHSKKPLISVVGEDSPDKSISLQRVQSVEKEDLIMKKLDSVLKFVKAMDSSLSSRILIEILCESVGMWTESVSTADAPRFVVPTERSEKDPEWNRLASHLVALFCFEQLGEWNVDPTDPIVVEAIAKLIEVVLKGTADWVLLEEADSGFFDVSRSPSEEQERMTAIRQTSAKMAVGLAAAVVAAGTAEVADSLKTISDALSLFIASSFQFKDADLLKTAEDAKQVIQLLNMLGMKTAEVASNSAAPSASKRRVGVGDFVTELKKDLSDEMVPIRGEALLRTARSLRRRDKAVLEALEPWLYERIRELVSDPDSYVFLSAINALAEVACYDSKKYLDQLLQLFLDLGKTCFPVEKDDSVLILRGKLAEVIGKVFRCLGDIAPFWIERAANIFLKALKDESDIIRASSISAFSDLVLSCRGKGLERIIDELFFAVDLLVQNDPSELVRRAAVHFIRQCLKSCDRYILDVVGGRLRDLRRTLSRLWKWDRDHVVRLQAELCLEEMRAGMQSALEEETSSMLRIINVK